MTTNEPPPVPDDPQSPTSDLPSYGSVPPPPPGSYPPPPPGGGYTPPVGGPSGFSATDAVGYGWKKFRENVGPIVLATLVLIVGSLVVSAIVGAITGSGFQGSGMTRDDGSFGFSASGLISQIITNTVSIVIGAGITRGALDITEGHKFNLVAAFRKLNLVNVILTSLLVSVLTVIGFVLLVIPGILVAFFTLFATYFVVDKDASPVEAIKSSFSLVRANIGNTLVLILLSIVVVIAGFLALCVGILVALPVLVIAWAYAYKTFLGEPVAQ